MSQKLCKDCKHVVLPNPFQQMYGASYSAPVIAPMCGHPDADRDPVYGNCTITCLEARGSTDKSICWGDAKLFEQAPPAPPLNPIEYAPAPTQRLSFWQRLFDRLA